MDDTPATPQGRETWKKAVAAAVILGFIALAMSFYLSIRHLAADLPEKETHPTALSEPPASATALFIAGTSSLLIALTYAGARKSGRKSALWWLAAMALSLALLMWMSIHSTTLDSQPLKIDESRWMPSAYYYTLYFERADYANLDWQSPISYEHPPVAGYVFGAALKLSGRGPIETNGAFFRWWVNNHRNFWLKHLDDAIQNDQNSRDALLSKYLTGILDDIHPAAGAKPAWKDILIGRTASYYAAVASALLLAGMMSLQLRRPLGGIAAAIILLTNHINNPLLQLVYTESLTTLFSLLALATLILLIQRMGRVEAGRQNAPLEAMGLSLLAGLWLALAIGTKFTAAYMAAAAALSTTAAAALSFRSARRAAQPTPIKRHLLCATMVLASAAVIFLLLDPFFWPDPITNAGKMLQFHSNMEQMQKDVSIDSQIHGPAKQITLIISRGILLDNGLKKTQSAATALVLLAAILAGALAIAYECKTELKKGGIGPYTTIAVWILVTYAINGYMLPINWIRYYEPFTLCAALTAGLGAEAIIGAVRRKPPEKTGVPANRPDAAGRP